MKNCQFKTIGNNSIFLLIMLSIGHSSIRPDATLPSPCRSLPLVAHSAHDTRSRMSTQRSLPSAPTTLASTTLARHGHYTLFVAPFLQRRGAGTTPRPPQPFSSIGAPRHGHRTHPPARRSLLQHGAHSLRTLHLPTHCAPHSAPASIFGRHRVLHAYKPPFVQATSRCCTQNPYCKHMFHVFQMF
jgi:hypothetical protein